jgi:membrane protein required for beta-lactamase induction
VAINKQSFYEGINQETIFNEDFFKKVLGYSMYDVPFLDAVAIRLTKIGRNNVSEQYNAWYAAWKAEDDQQMKKVAEWFHKECDRDFENRQKEQQKKVVEDWKEKRVALLLEKKRLLQSTEN